MADADGDQLHGAAGFDHFDDLAQMLLQITAMIDRQGAVVHGCAVGNHHQYAAVFGAGDQAVMRPEQSLSVDIFFQQPFAHHQAQIALGMPPWLIGFFVDDMAQVVEAAGHGLASGGEPVLARLPALPRAGGEAQYFGFDAAPFQGARQYVGADRGDANGASAHRTAIVYEQGDYSIAKIGLAFDFVGQRASR